MSKKRILIISYVSPFPPDSGGSAGNYYLLNELRQKINISLIFPFDKRKIYEIQKLHELWPDVILYPFNQNNGRTDIFRNFKRTFKKWFSVAKEILTNDPEFDLKRRSYLFRNHNQDISTPFRNFVAEIIAKNDFDLYQVEFYPLITLCEVLPVDKPKLFIHHELNFVRAERELAVLKQKTDFAMERVHKIHEDEIDRLTNYDKVITLTETDLEYLKNDIRIEKLSVSPLTLQFSPDSIDRSFYFKNKLLFLGGSGHFPNVDGINWFLHETWDKLLTFNPQLHLEITGYWEKRYQRKLSRFNNVHFAGFIINLHNICDGSIMIVPLRIGSGMRMKIIEAVQQAIPFISTTIGAEGLGLEHNTDCEIADTPEEFCNSLIKLQSSPQLQDKYINNARRKMKKKFDHSLAVSRRLSIYESL
jgi:glycosyltransferase involved in cell wall biosynthesis